MVTRTYVAGGIIGCILVIAILGAGCTSPINENSVVPPGFQSSTTGLSETNTPVSLMDAIGLLASQAQKNNQPTPKIYYFRGIRVNRNGAAAEWTIGAMEGNSSLFFTYNGKKESVVWWPDTFPYDEIVVGKFMLPNELFNSHKLLIEDLIHSGNQTISELELQNGVYTLSEKSELRKFDAVTGMEIP